MFLVQKWPKLRYNSHHGVKYEKEFFTAAFFGKYLWVFVF